MTPEEQHVNLSFGLHMLTHTCADPTYAPPPPLTGLNWIGDLRTSSDWPAAVWAQLKGSGGSVSSGWADLEKGKLWFSCTSVSAQHDFVGLHVLLLYL